MTFQKSIRTCFSKYVTFSGRASRSEYWWFMLFLLLGSIAATIVNSVIFGPTVEGTLQVRIDGDGNQTQSLKESTNYDGGWI
ncbi:MAG: DUF805 domain-containing protein, partial [Rhodobacteraceae bacterium]|nr:DUF805 domain-containing protein [Paracoccaceae bacterium]